MQFSDRGIVIPTGIGSAQLTANLPLMADSIDKLLSETAIAFAAGTANTSNMEYSEHNFPEGRFTAPPILLLSAKSVFLLFGNEYIPVPSVRDVTKSSFFVKGSETTGNDFYWVAIQLRNGEDN